MRRDETDRRAFADSETLRVQAEREEDFPRISIPLDAALCPHRMVVNEGDTEHPDCLILPDAGRDWRFKQNVSAAFSLELADIR